MREFSPNDPLLIAARTGWLDASRRLHPSASLKAFNEFRAQSIQGIELDDLHTGRGR